MKTGTGKYQLLIAAAAILCSCGANPLPTGGTASSESAITRQQDEEAAASSATIRFYHSDFYSLTEPDPSTGCAGDAKTYYQTGDGEKFEDSVLEPSMTIKPAFIKNVSVDLTDANAPISSNLASSCALSSAGGPATSSCASFDYGAIGGVPTSLGGTVMMIGGVTGASSFGPGLSCGTDSSGDATTCTSAIRALAIDSLPASEATDPPSALAPGITSATGPISSWALIQSASGSATPLGLAGASTSFSPTAHKALVFGGATGSGSLAMDSADTWSFDLSSLKWTDLNAAPFASISQMVMDDIFNSTFRQLAQSVGARSQQGYTAVPHLALSAMSTDGTTDPANIDTTDRIVTLGGFTTTTQGDLGLSQNAYKFNPTFGPELVDRMNASTGAPGVGGLAQWAESYHTQLLNNADTATQFQPDLKTNTNALAHGFSIAPLTNSTTVGLNTVIGGEFLTFGGFDYVTQPEPPGDEFNSAPVYLAQSQNGFTADIAMRPTDLSGNHLTPLTWTAYTEAPDSFPWYGGAVLLPGFRLGQNDLVYFGGSMCSEYLTNTALTNADCEISAADGGTAANLDPGMYMTFGASPNPAVAPTTTAMAGTAPHKAGIAAARGTDGAGNVIIVSWGGFSQPADNTSDPSVQILYNAGGLSPTWVSVTPSGSMPPTLANAAMVFSHITHKFYLFGGYQRAGITDPSGGRTVGDTWELTITGSAGAYAASWRQLNVAGGLTCYPDCPEARRSHRMVEVNYDNIDPTSEPVCNNPAAPCSFGIFMEGGTPDGVAVLSDRWMFDPTANNGWGHWQRVNGFPPRHLASMATLEYKLPSTGQIVKRALLFGGETALDNPQGGVAGNHYVAPTLGDTYLYDFDSNSWNRVELLGKGYNGLPSSFSSEFEKRQAYDATRTDPSALTTIAELTPPPLAGAMMVVRTLPQGTKNASSPPTPLAIPQVFLFGGRTKDGKLLPLDHVYKFCVGTTGEKPYSVGTDDASCDAYDPSTNPDSPSPSASYIGRWLRKAPDTTTLPGPTPASFEGAAAYDSARDRIVLFGGVSSTAGTTVDAVTESTWDGPSEIFEYTPPSKTDATPATGNSAGELNGAWTAVPACATAPSARYGHTMTYLPNQDELVVVGGYDMSGSALLTTVSTYDGDFKVPQVWTAKRDDINNCYDWQEKTIFGNILSDTTKAPPEDGLSYSGAFYIPASGYSTGYYSTLDQYCANEGPVASADPSISKLLAGGVYIDINRAALGPNENLLLNLTYYPLGPENNRPDGDVYTPDQQAYFKIHLIKDGEDEDTLRRIFQPRYFTYTDSENYPTVVDTLSVLGPPGGGVRQDQILIPLAIDPDIDRIRIERYSGSAILISASLYRMGYR